MSELLTNKPEQEDKVEVSFELPSDYEGIVKVETSPVDNEGFVRPMYSIAGLDRKIVFVNSKEEVLIEGENEDFSRVPTSPEALLAVAIDARPDDPKLRQMLDNITEKTFTKEETELLDNMSAALAMESEDKIAPHDQTEGLALVISALIGNEAAKKLVNQKRNQYLTLTKAKQEEEKHKLKSEVEPGTALDWNQIAFVHSTPHELMRDESGNIVLYPYSHHHAGSETSYPRATLHFTVNSEVEGHLFGSWKASNRLIVTNGQRLLDNNTVSDKEGEKIHLPARMNVIDTYWSQSPGEALNLEGATVVEPTPDLQEIFVEDSEGHVIRYLDKAEYTDDERKQIFLLQQEQFVKSHYPQEEWESHMKFYREDSVFSKERIEALRSKESATLRKIALAAAMRQQGVDTPLVGLEQWSSNNPQFDASFNALAQSEGVSMGIHSQSPEDMLESRVNSGYYTALNPSSSFTQGKLEAQRTLVAYGFIMPIKKTTVKPSFMDSLM